MLRSKGDKMDNQQESVNIVTEIKSKEPYVSTEQEVEICTVFKTLLEEGIDYE